MTTTSRDDLDRLNPADEPAIDAALAVLRTAVLRCDIYTQEIQSPEVRAALEYLVERRAIGIGNARLLWMTGLHPLRARRALSAINVEVARGRVDEPFLYIWVRADRARFFMAGLKLWAQRVYWTLFGRVPPPWARRI